MVFSSPSVRFGPFRWDAANRLLLRDDAEIPLPPRVLALLECLIERPGQVIPRQELTDRVWRDAFVTDTSLAEAISYLRQALGDDTQSPTYIQTLHRRGYRFIAPVEVEPQPVAQADERSVSRDAAVGIAPVRPSIGVLVPWSLVVLLGATLIVAIWKLTHPPAATQPRVTRFELALPPGITLRANTNNIAASPDGRSIAFVGCDSGVCRLFVRDLTDLDPRVLEDTADAAAPFFSPDGRSIGFFAEGKLKRTTVAGGTPAVLSDAPDALGATWLSDGRIIFAAHRTGGLEAVGDNGGPPVHVTRVDARAGELGHHAPHWTPGTDYLTFTATTARDDRQADRAMVLSLSTTRTQVLAGRASAAALMSADTLLFARGSDLEAARFDPQRGLMAGVPVSIAGDLRAADEGAPIFAVSAQGTLVQASGRSRGRQLEIVRGTDVQPLAESLARMREGVLDSTGQRLAGIISDGSRGDLWIGDTARGTMTRVSNTYTAAAPIWSRDGRHLFFSTAVDGAFNLWTADPAALSSARLLTSAAHQFPSDVTPAGGVVFTQIDPARQGDIWVRTADGQLTGLVQTAFDERDGAVSPDGRWLAYLSDESGRWQVYLKSMQGGNRIVVSEPGAGRPYWLTDGRLVYPKGPGTLAEVHVTADGPSPANVSRTFDGGSVVAVAPSGAVLLSRQHAPLGAPIVTIEAWQEIWRTLPPAIGNLPR